MVDYSKWKDIEVSDDEDDTHPNIDTPSLFKWRHEARLNRMEEHEQEKKDFENQVKDHAKKKEDIVTRKKIGEDVEDLEKEWKKEEDEIKKRKEELDKKEKLMPWNVDTIAKPGFSKSAINVKKKADKKEMTEEEKALSLKEFTKKYQPELKKFGMLRKYEDSKAFLLENPHFACEETANYLVVWCIELAMMDKKSLMEHVSHQAIAIQFLLELAKQLDVDPRSCISSFFTKIAMAENTEYKHAFNAELQSFRERIELRAEQKIQEALDEERLERLGPGGLDPEEVMAELPKDLQKCFESRDVDLLKQTITNYTPEEANMWLKKCIDSGLWVADASTLQDEAAGDGDGDKDTETKDLGKAE